MANGLVPSFKNMLHLNFRYLANLKTLHTFDTNMSVWCYSIIFNDFVVRSVRQWNYIDYGTVQMY